MLIMSETLTIISATSPDPQQEGEGLQGHCNNDPVWPRYPNPHSTTSQHP